MSKLSPLKKGIWRSQALINPVLGSSISIQPNVVAKLGGKNEIQKPNSKTLAKRILVRASNHETKIPRGKAITCNTMPIFTLFHSERQMPYSLKASRQAFNPYTGGSAIVALLKLLIRINTKGYRTKNPMMPISPAISAVPPLSGGSQERITGTGLSVSVFAISQPLSKPP